jgi:hypothetical protein
MDGAFDPPSLHCKVTCSDFLMMNNTSTTTTLYDDFMYKMIASFPERWCNNESSAPGERPWMIDELNQLMKETLIPHILSTASEKRQIVSNMIIEDACSERGATLIGEIPLPGGRDAIDILLFPQTP